MSPTTLAHPEWLSALVWIGAASALALAAAHLLARRRRRRLLGWNAPPPAATLTSDAALLVAFAAIALALLGPRIGERDVSISSTGVDVVFLVDVSRSMDAEDVPPSRLDRARRAVEEILARLAPGDRAALAAFAEHGLLLTPLTPDRSALLELLAGVDTQLIEPADSDLADGVRAALAAFEAGGQRPRVVFVASDGESPRRRRDVGGAAAVRHEVRVVTAALGTEAGSHVPDGGRPLRDRRGAVVVSRRDSGRLSRLAAETGGETFVGDEWGRIDFERATAAIRRDVGAGGERVERRVAAVRVAPFAALAFALLLLEGLPWPGAVRARRAARVRGGIAALVCAGGALSLLAAGAFPTADARGADPGPGPASSTLAGLEARVRLAPEDARAHLDLGLARLERGRSDAAARAFLAAAVYARETQIAAVAYYDLGVAHLARGDLAAARDAFFDVLSVDPSDREARFNLEWTLQALRQSPQTPAAPPDAANEGAPEPARPDADPKAAPEAPADARPEGTTTAPAMSEAQRRRWLERAEDDPRAWLRAAAGARDDVPHRPAGPAW